jgi:uncharacterized repeat protein (TIGR01451 family)
MSAPTAERRPAEPRTRRGTARAASFAAFAAVLVLLAVGYVVWAAARPRPVAPPPAGVLAPGTPAIMFQDLAGGDAGGADRRGEVALAPLADPDGPRVQTGLRCDRVYYAGGHGLCLASDAGFPPVEQAQIFGPDFRVTHAIQVDGLPSRARVSPDGRYGAATIFLTGHSYIDSGFSTATTLIDMASGNVVANLEQFTVMRDGRTVTAPDDNFWGITFAADSNRFYATLATGGHTFLVAGDVAARRVVVERENVECPSLSPDGTRIGFKKRVDDGSGSPVWRFYVLDLATGVETPLAETRSVDDQLEWLDDHTLLYGDPDSVQQVWAVAADGSGTPHAFVERALSPAVLRVPLPDAVGAPQLAAPGPPPPSVGIAATAPSTAAPGVPVVHTLTVTNRGPAEATQVVVEDTLVGAGRVRAATADTPPRAGGYGCTVSTVENRVRCDLPRLPAGEVWTITVTVDPAGAGALDGRAIVGTADRDPATDKVVELHTLVG